MENLEIRLASVADYDAVVELSRATYEDKADEDHDYIPNRFHGWLSEPKRAVFVAEMEEQIVGLRSFVVVNDDQSSTCDVEKIHPKFRSQGLQIKMIEANRDFIRKKIPECGQRTLLRSKEVLYTATRAVC